MSPYWAVMAKREWADHRIRETKELVSAYIETEPYPLRFKINDEGRGYTVVDARVMVRQPPPEELALAFGDAVHALRSTLDYLVWELTLDVLGIDQPSEVRRPWLRKVQFPISTDPDDFTPKNATGSLTESARVWPMLRGVRKYQAARIEALQPFGNPRHGLAVLAQLDNVHKHRHTHITAGVHQVSIQHKIPYARKVITQYIHAPGSVQHNTLLATVRFHPAISRGDIEPVMNMCLKRSFSVTLGKGAPAEGQELLAVLSWLKGRVTTIVKQF